MTDRWYFTDSTAEAARPIIFVETPRFAPCPVCSIGSVVRLKKPGKRLIGVCPEHGEFDLKLPP